MADEPMGDEPVFETVLDAVEIIDELPDLARIDAWASSVLGMWAEDSDAQAIDAHFLGWLRSHEGAAARKVLDAVSSMAEPVDGEVAPTRAWRVTQRDATSVGIGFHLADGSEHSLLVDVVDSELTALIVAPGPDELFDGAEDLVAPEPIEVVEAAIAMVDAWDVLVSRRRVPPEDVWVNGALARARLAFLLETDTSQFARPFETDPDVVGVSAEERSELDAWAVSVLDGARVGQGIPGDPVLLEPLQPESALAWPSDEREAFASLEWADWLGVVLGLHRAAVGTLVEPGMLIDLINRCPEVTSTIPKKDRPYYEWAWSMVVPVWRDAGVIDAENHLAGGGADALVAALRQAWAA